MKVPDLLNGLFELGGGGLTWFNVVKLRKDRKVRGIDWRVVTFFMAWGLWNLFYYPSLGQGWSTAGGAVMTIANTAWLWLAIKYRKN